MSDAENTVTATPPPGGTATATVSPPATSTKIVEHDVASELPEANWGWRRAFTFAVTAALLALTWHIVGRVSDVATLRMVARDALGLVALAMLLYVAGASATDIVKLISAVRTTRRETVTTGPTS